MTEKPLNEYIDMEAYDVVPGYVHRALKEQLEAQQRLLDAHRQEFLDVFMEMSARDHLNQEETDAQQCLEEFEAGVSSPAKSRDSA